MSTSDDPTRTNKPPKHNPRAPHSSTILGKALEPLDVGTGLIKVLVMLR
jgi:hypothetical protein